MADYYRWLLERTLWSRLWCRADVEKMGRPHQIHFATQSMRYEYEAFAECLERYEQMVLALPADQSSGLPITPQSGSQN